MATPELERIGPGRKRFHSRDVLMTTAQASAYTGLSAATIKHLAQTRRLAHEVLVTSRRPLRRYRRSELDKLLRVIPADVSTFPLTSARPTAILKLVTHSPTEGLHD